MVCAVAVCPATVNARKDTSMTTTRHPVAGPSPGTGTLRERSATTPSAPGATDDAQPARMMTASRLCGNKVINHQNETLGQVDEIVIDLPSGRVAYAAMASGGFLGLGERLFAVPWTALRYDAGRECFLMDARKETFENAPGFDKDHWPTQAQSEWHDSVHRFYGAPLYWN
jgi:sporulation protein YlmC with PRC-barrel domain